MSNIREEMRISALHEKHKHGLTDKQAGLEDIEELFGYHAGTQEYLNYLLVEKIERLEKAVLLLSEKLK